MLTEIIILVSSLVALVFAADKFVELVERFALSNNVSPMVVGLTIVAIGTSLPELAASVAGALDGITGIAVGNVFGSNICNIGLILGVPAIVHPIRTHRSKIMKQGRLMLLATFFVVAVMFVFGGIQPWQGGVFLAFFFWYMYDAYNSGQLDDELGDTDYVEKLGLPEVLLMIGSFAAVVVSSKFLVSSTSFIAREVGVPEDLIAFTLIALGTSLPELSVSLAAARRRQGDILIGNVMGSNVCNLLLVLGATSVVHPRSIDIANFYYDIGFTVFFSLLMFFMLLRPMGINKTLGILLLITYITAMVVVSVAKTATL